MRVAVERRHSFGVSHQQAEAIQQRLRGLLSDEPPKRVERVAGAYALFGGGEEGARVAAAACVVRLPGLEVVEQLVVPPKAALPYRPGFLAFSVGPALIAALEALAVEPEVVLFAAHGRAHPRGLGLAAHLGVLFDVATVGCAAELLVDEGGEDAAQAVHTRAGVRPVFVSAGHRMDLETAVGIVRQCCPRYRTPEPLRRARALLRQRRVEEGWG